MVRLSKDVEIAADARGVCLHSPDQPALDLNCRELEWLETFMHQSTRLTNATNGTERVEDQQHDNGLKGEDYSQLLKRLDRRGWLVHSLRYREVSLVSCVPVRPPSRPLPRATPTGGWLQFSHATLIRPSQGGWRLGVPGAWAHLRVHDQHLLPSLYGLAEGCMAAEWLSGCSKYPRQVRRDLILLMKWSQILGLDSGLEGWNLQDLWFHTATRRGYSREPLGKEKATPTERQRSILHLAQPIGVGIVDLERPDPEHWRSQDPPFAMVCEHRRSRREPSQRPISKEEVSNFLFRSMASRHGHQLYPSGGGCYSVRTYLAVHHCEDLSCGAYFYDPNRHRLKILETDRHLLSQLFKEQSATANSCRWPQIGILLTADYGRVRKYYPRLAYSLILKEVGAIMQTMMLAARVTGLDSCPLGCGNETLISKLIGTDSALEPTVGELMLIRTQKQAPD